MADIKHEHRANTDKGLGLRDVVGAWLICGMIAVMALTFSGDPHAPPASAVSPAFANAGTKTFAIGSAPQGMAAAAPRIPHWEWQYGYIGHHARYAPHWVLVR